MQPWPGSYKITSYATVYLNHSAAGQRAALKTTHVPCIHPPSVISPWGIVRCTNECYSIHIVANTHARMTEESDSDSKYWTVPSWALVTCYTTWRTPSDTQTDR